MSSLEPFQHRSVEFGETAHELLDVARAQRRWNQSFKLHARQFDTQPHLTTKDDELPRHVGAGQVVARVGLRVAVRLRHAYNFRERLLAVPDVEQIGQRAGENAFDAPYLVSRFAKITQRLDDRQSRADRRLIEIMRPAARRASCESS